MIDTALLGPWVRRFLLDRTLRVGYAIIDGSQEHHPEAIYYLRYLQDGKRRWHAVGSNADAAISTLRNTKQELQAMSLGVSTPRVTTVAANDCDTQGSISLTEAIDTYLAEVRRFKSPKTITDC